MTAWAATPAASCRSLRGGQEGFPLGNALLDVRFNAQREGGFHPLQLAAVESHTFWSSFSNGYLPYFSHQYRICSFSANLGLKVTPTLTY